MSWLVQIFVADTVHQVGNPEQAFALCPPCLTHDQLGTLAGSQRDLSFGELASVSSLCNMVGLIMTGDTNSLTNLLVQSLSATE